ncbi:MAG: hypothetical protein P8R42_21910 [Candidatus Binatia bacterium]|nr:hypothetical protein [Candidatus Binatia bacterium]
MSRTTARRALWTAALFLAPVPLLAFADAFVPTMRVVELALVVAITIFVEGSHGVALLLLGLLAAHIVVYGLLLWLGARVLAASIERAAPAALGGITLALIGAGLLVTIAFPVYDSPFHARLPHTSLLEVYQ